MEHGYVVVKENILESDESEWGYPPYISTQLICICETQESAEKMIKNLQQNASDRFMDWLDENIRYLITGDLSIDNYHEEDDDFFPDGTTEYYVKEVPYYNN